MWSLGFTVCSGSAENEQMTLDIMTDKQQSLFTMCPFCPEHTFNKTQEKKKNTVTFGRIDLLS